MKRSIAIGTLCISGLGLGGCDVLQDQAMNFVFSQGSKALVNGASGSSSRGAGVQQQAQVTDWAALGRQEGAASGERWKQVGVPGLEPVAVEEWNAIESRLSNDLALIEFVPENDASALKLTRRAWIIGESTAAVSSDLDVLGAFELNTLRAMQMRRLVRHGMAGKLVSLLGEQVVEQRDQLRRSTPKSNADTIAYSNAYAESLYSSLEGYNGQSAAQALRDFSRVRAQALMQLYIQTYGDDGIGREVLDILETPVPETKPEPEVPSGSETELSAELIGYTIGANRMPVFRRSDGTVYSFDASGKQIDASKIPWEPTP